MYDAHILAATANPAADEQKSWSHSSQARVYINRFVGYVFSGEKQLGYLPPRQTCAAFTHGQRSPQVPQLRRLITTQMTSSNTSEQIAPRLNPELDLLQSASSHGSRVLLQEDSTYNSLEIGELDHTAQANSLALRQLIFEYRNHGHVYAKTDPLNLRQAESSISPLLKASLVLAQHVLGPKNGPWSRPLTEPETRNLRSAGLYDLLSNPNTLVYLGKQFLPWTGKKVWTSGEVLETLRRAYASRVGVEWMHITWRARQAWIRDHVESAAYLSLDPRTFPYMSPSPALKPPETDDDFTIQSLESLEPLGPELAMSEPVYSPTYYTFSPKERLAALYSVIEAEQLELFMSRNYRSAKRFSLEGAEALIPALRTLLRVACTMDVTHVELGMAHRGRLNVLAHVLQKKSELFAHFDDQGMAFSLGDVKYHLGTSVELNLLPLEPISRAEFEATRQRMHIDTTHVRNKSAQDILANDPYELIGHPFHLDEFSDVIHTQQRKRLSLSLSANPSHLEWVDPVVLGRSRSLQDDLRARIEAEQEDTKQKNAGAHDQGVDVMQSQLLQRAAHQPRQEGDRAPSNEALRAAQRSILPVLVHGDASFCGQGIVAETLELSGLTDYSTGGAIHIVVNNQIGFTTSPRRARSALQCTDVAKAVGAPIFHVNADDIDAVMSVVALAVRYRMQFASPVVVDLVCYRRRGHNEQDDPSITQPRMYKAIAQHPSVSSLYAARLYREGLIPADGLEIITKAVDQELTAAFEKSKGLVTGPRAWLANSWQATALELAKTRAQSITLAAVYTKPFTGIDRGRLRMLMKHLCTLPTTTFDIHPAVRAMLEKRLSAFEENDDINWATAEALAFGSLLLEGHSVRLSGQDVQRGTFNQRHAVIIDQTTEELWVPLRALGQSKLIEGDPTRVGRFTASNSSLSEAAVLGFEYGYSLVKSSSGSLTIWEAQFGDFLNCAQPIIDCFVVSGESKWFAPSNLVILLPHGMEGQGPDHSSARLERILQMVDEDQDHLPGSGSRVVDEVALGFDVLDEDGKGWIERETLRKALIELRLRCSVPAYFSTIKQGSQAPDSSAPSPQQSELMELDEQTNGNSSVANVPKPSSSSNRSAIDFGDPNVADIITEEEVDEVFRELDPTNSGRVTKEAWIAYMRHLAFHNAYRSINMIVVQPTTPSNYFHALRRQSRQSLKPLIIFTPKSLLHHQPCQSKASEFTTGTRFQPVITDDAGCIRYETELETPKQSPDGQTSYGPKEATSLIHSAKANLTNSLRSRRSDSPNGADNEAVVDEKQSQASFPLPPESVPYGWRATPPSPPATGPVASDLADAEPPDLVQGPLFGDAKEEDANQSAQSSSRPSASEATQIKRASDDFLSTLSTKEHKSLITPSLANAAQPGWARVRRLVFCTGKIYYTLRKKRNADENLKQKVVLVRLEQLAPFPFTEVAAVIKRYPNAELVWAQDEPKNMGAWGYVQRRIHAAIKAADALLRYAQLGQSIVSGSTTANSATLSLFPVFVDRSPGWLSHRYLRYIGRPTSAATATGSTHWHRVEEYRILYEVFDLSTDTYSGKLPPSPPSSRK